MIDKLNDQLHAMYKVTIDGGDLDTISELTGVSRFTVWQYFAGKGKSVSTAEDMLKCAMKIVNERNRSIERAEILNEDLNND